ncbi:MAG: hypothetical protein IJP48_01900 [Synergistaceae bacterium]|nr:hypothetical protein [Synergistaceae bacterium]
MQKRAYNAVRSSQFAVRSSQFAVRSSLIYLFIYFYNINISRGMSE